jgi:succinate dehydrogenase / fumarate reductase flavoprotein subunit
MIRTLQDRAVAAGIEVYMECTINRLVMGPDGPTGAFGYWRTTGAPMVFPAKSIVLATGGIGKAYEITSNSWEYSGDGQALAYEAGAELIDMEFVQFHPTGDGLAAGVRGLLVTEAVRGEGGILRNSLGERFMWKYLPEDRRAEYAATDEEAAQWVEALSAGRETEARRPPELSTRDNVARAIYTEVKEGRGTPHGGVYLDISYLPPEHVRRKLPSMYEQFKELADVDITAGPMEVGPTTHYVMGGIRVDAESARRPCRGCSRRARSPAGCTAQSAGWQLAVGPARVRCPSRGGRGRAGGRSRPTEPYLDPVMVQQAIAELSAPLERTDGEDPYALQRDLQETMQRLVGIFREESDLDEAIAAWPSCAAAGGRSGRPAVAPTTRAGTSSSSWAPADHLRGDRPQRRARTESRGAHSRLDHPATDDKRWGQRNIAVARRPMARCASRRRRSRR